MKNKINFNVGDVYGFRYNAEGLKTVTWKGDPYHCFDGQLVVKQNGDKIYLEDTYWSSDNIKFDPNDVEELGTLSFKFNLNDIEPVEKYNLNYYDDDDLFCFSTQHHCIKSYNKRKGSTKSREKMLRVATEQLSENEYKIKSLENSIKFLKEKITWIEDDNHDINTIYL